MNRKMPKSEIIKLRVDSFIKQKALEMANTLKWTLSKYIRFLLLMDFADHFLDHVTEYISENVDTVIENIEFTFQGRRFYIVPENQKELFIKFLNKKQKVEYDEIRKN